MPRSTQNENTGSGSLRWLSGIWFFSVSALRRRGCLHRLNETDHDELSGDDWGNTDFTKQHAAVDLIRRIGLGITFYEERLLGIPSHQHPFVMEISQEGGGSVGNQLPRSVVVWLERD